MSKGTYVVWNNAAVGKTLTRAEKSLIALGHKIERKMKTSLTNGIGSLPPAVDTGRLRASISTNWSDSSGLIFGGSMGVGAGDNVKSPVAGKNEFVVAVGTNVPYAPHVEFGTVRNLIPRPFLKIAYEEVKVKASKLIKDRMKGGEYGGVYGREWTEEKL